MFNELKKIFGSKFNRLKNNIFANSFQFSSLILLQILLVPFMIKGWGIHTYGVWIFLMSVPAALSFANIDVVESVRQELVLNKDKKINYLNKIFSNSFACTLINLFVFTIFYFSLYFFLSDKFKVFSDYNNEYLFIIIVIIAIGYSFDTVAKNILISVDFHGKLHLSTLINSIFLLIPNVLIAIAGFYFTDLTIAAIIYLAASAIKFLTSIFFLIKESKLSFFLLSINFRTIKYIYSKSKSYYLNNISALVYISGFNFIVGLFYSAEFVTLINSLNTLFRWSVSRLTSIFLMPLYFEYANYYNEKKFKKLIQLFNLQKKILLYVLFLYVLVSITLGEYVFNLWTLNKFSNFYTLLVLIVFENLLHILGNNYLIYLKSINKFYFFAKADLILSLFVIASLFFLGYNKFNLELLIVIVIIRSLIAFFILRKSYLQIKLLKKIKQL